MDLKALLNEEQLAAATHTEGPLLVLAGAGSGKTRCVTYRIIYLIESGVPADEILGLTFTNKAAKEMRQRVEKLSKHKVWISTFHSLCARLLRESIEALGISSQFTIYDADDASKVLRSCIKELNLEEKQYPVKNVQTLISRAKNALQSADDLDESTLGSKIEKALPAIYRLYEKRLREFQSLDFDDLLLMTVRLFRECPDVLSYYQNKWQFVHVDEYQDTNEAQYELVRMLVAKSQNLFVVGDPDQSIYSWRGADIHNILNFERDFPKATVIRLEQNYRSTCNILEAANILVQHNVQRYEKKLWSNIGEGEIIKRVIVQSDRDEARFVAERIRYHHEEGVALNDMVVFYRTNSQSRAFEDQLSSLGLSYTIVGSISFYQRREIKDILAYLRLSVFPSDFISFNRCLNAPKRGLGQITIEKLQRAASHSQLPIIVYCRALLAEQPLATVVKLSQKQRDGLQAFLAVIEELQRLQEKEKISDLVSYAIKESGYFDYLAQDAETFSERKDNLNELIGKAMEWEESLETPHLTDFLEELALKTSSDEKAASDDRVTLMTLHNGKGLEFKLVFMVGMEEDLFPHAIARESCDEMEEERRLCYVGMTRAKELLYLCHALTRRLWGTLRPRRASRFFDEIPEQYVQTLRDFSGRSGCFQQSSADAFIDDIDQTKGEAALKKGDAVFHRSFGYGVIQDAYQGSLGLTYKVRFANELEDKELVAKFAKLNKI